MVNMRAAADAVAGQERTAMRAQRTVFALAVSGLIAPGLAGCGPLPTSRPALEVTQHAAVAGATEVVTVLGRHAVNALVLPLLDDAEPPRLTTVALPLMCADQEDVRINGRPIVEGAEAPAGSFVVDWQFAGTCPFGIDGPRLSGAAEVVVLRDDDAGLQALVRARPAMQVARGVP
jgi:hypothetical protein